MASEIAAAPCISDPHQKCLCAMVSDAEITDKLAVVDELGVRTSSHQLRFKPPPLTVKKLLFNFLEGELVVQMWFVKEEHKKEWFIPVRYLGTCMNRKLKIVVCLCFCVW